MKRHEVDDDDLSGSYKYFGAAQIYGKRSVLPLRIRLGTINAFDPDVYNPIRCSALSETEVDYLIFVLFNVKPSALVASFQCKTNGALKRLMATEGHRILRAQPSRHAGLAADLSNLKYVAEQLGFPANFFDDRTAQRSLTQLALDDMQVAAFVDNGELPKVKAENHMLQDQLKAMQMELDKLRRALTQSVAPLPLALTNQPSASSSSSQPPQPPQPQPESAPQPRTPDYPYPYSEAQTTAEQDAAVTSIL